MLLTLFFIIVIKNIKTTEIKILENETDHSFAVTKLRIRDVNNSLLDDLYPIYFWTEFEINNHSIQLLFTRILSSNDFEFSRSYRTIFTIIDKQNETRKAEAKCVLYLRFYSYKIVRILKLQAARSWFAAKNRSLLDVYYIDLSLKMHDGLMIRMTFDLFEDRYVGTINRLAKKTLSKFSILQKSWFL